MVRIYNKITGLESILSSFDKFAVGKKQQVDVVVFRRNLEDNIFTLHDKFKNKTYQHGKYQTFYVKDPKLRQIHKASVEDRLVHNMASFHLERIFDKTFMENSYSCRKNKGTHKAVMTLWSMAQNLSTQSGQNCWALKCDIKKFFASVDQNILLKILGRTINDQDFLDLLEKIIKSFHSNRTTNPKNKKGIPLGNLTSQFFANIYLNELDQFITRTLKIQNYIRYADDFVICNIQRDKLVQYIDICRQFLNKNLKLELHPDKIYIRKFRSGVDFLGYVIFPNYILPRTKTKKRLFRKIKKRIDEYKAGKITEFELNQTIQSYMGYLGWANSYKLRQELENLIWFHLA